MISKTWSRKPIAACVAIAILSVYSMVVLASPAAKAPSAELSVSGSVTVNGENALSGGTMFSDSFIATSEKSNATVNLSKVGRVDLGANSNGKLSFTEKSLNGLVEVGTFHVTTLAGVGVNFTTKDALVVVDGSQPTAFTVSVANGVTSLTTHTGVAELRVANSVKTIAAGETATAGTPDDDTPGDDDDDMSTGETFALVALGAGAVAAIIWAVIHDNDLNFGGSTTVISPTR